MKKYFAILLLFTLSLNKVFTQASVSPGGGTSSSSRFKPSQQSIPFTPTAEAFEKYGNLPINLANGIPNISIPIKTLDVNGFKWPISLSYHASGLKPSDIASCVGTGWNLNAFGVINTSIVGNGSYQSAHNREGLDLYLYEISGLGVCIPRNEEHVRIADEIVSNGGTTGYACFNLVSAIINAKFTEADGTYFTIPASNKKIVYDYTNFGFIITDEEGNEYHFLEKGDNRSVSSCSSRANGNVISKKIAVSYFLNKIITYSKDQILFKYNSIHYSYKKAPLIINKKTDPIIYHNQCAPIVNETTTCENTYLCNDRVLSEIETSTGEKIKFNYDTRNDLIGSLRLTSIDILNNQYETEKKLHSITLTQSYFGSGSTAENLRLKLDEVRFLDKNNQFVNSYRAYYHEENVPSRLMPDYDVSHLLTTNGGAGSGSFFNIFQEGTLKRLQYPTGGETVFNFEVLRGLGRMRIKTITDYDGNNTITNQKYYHYPDPVPSHVPLSFVETEQITNRSCIENLVSEINCVYIHTRNSPIEFSGSGEEFSTGHFYERVTELLGYNGVGGKVEYTFQKLQERGNFFVAHELGLSPQLVEKRVYQYDNGTFKLLEEHFNIYSIPDAPQLPPTGIYASSSGFPEPLERNVYIKKVIKINDYQEIVCQNTGASNPAAANKIYICSNYSEAHHYLFSVPERLEKQIVKNYSSNNSNQVLTQVTDYFYDDNYNLNPSRILVTNSKGEVTQTKLWYTTLGNQPTNYASYTTELPKLTALKNSNRINTVYYSEVSKNNVLLSKEEQVFDFFNNGKVNLIAEKKYPRNSSQYIENKILSYTNFDKPNEILESNGIKTSYLYNTLSKNVIAIVNHASKNQIAYSSFELNEETSFSSMSNQRLNDGYTGSFSYLLTNGNIVKSNLPVTTYSITCWARNGNVYANQLPMQASITKNGWTLYKITITGSNFTISGNATIDELRIHPQSSICTTFTYNEYGVSNICNDNNVTSTYVYNTKGGLARIKDDNNFILKEFEKTYISEKANWQLSGQLRCKPCPLNPTYTVSILEQQEIDQNPASSTYHQTRWIDYGSISQSCEDGWVLTNQERCETYVSEGATRNTGWKERKKQNFNPCSPAFNQVVWIRTNANLTDCSPPFVFAKFSTEPTPFSNPDENLASFYVEFFSDYHCTIPIAVNNLTVNYKIQVQNFNYRFNWTTNTSNNHTIICNGTRTYIAIDFVKESWAFGADWEDINNPNLRMVSYTLTNYIGLDGTTYDLGFE